MKNLQLATLGIACLMVMPLAAADPPAADPAADAVGRLVRAEMQKQCLGWGGTTRVTVPPARG